MAADVPRSKRILLGCSGFMFLSLALMLAVTWVSQPSLPLETVSIADLRTAEKKWQAYGPLNYDLTVEVGGTRAATYRVEVRGGVAQQAWLDGRPVKQRRLFSVWSVPGMFNTMEREFELVDIEDDPQDIVIRCHWNSDFGYPQSYQRISEIAGDIDWKVTRFVSYPDGNDQ